MNAQQTFCILPILTFHYFSRIPYSLHFNPPFYSLLKEMSYKTASLNFNNEICSQNIIQTKIFTEIAFGAKK